MPEPSRWPGRLTTVAVALGLTLTSCGPAEPEGSPRRSPAAATAGIETRPPATPVLPGLSWVRSADVARPDEAFAGASASPMQPSGPGTAGHPGHFPGQAIVDDVVHAGDRYVAVGYVGLQGSWTAIGWTSDDGDHWALTTIDDEPGSFAVDTAAGAGSDGRVIAVGRSGGAPVAWDSRDGRDWTRGTVRTLDDATWERMVSVTATGSGFLAGGSAGPELGERQARFWQSDDGTSWEPIPHETAFDGAEVVDIVPIDGGYVALGRLGTGQRASGSVAWTSPDGVAWTRADAPALAAGLVAAGTAGPDGTLVAVGSDRDERAALVWRSTDGLAWDLAPIEESRLYNGDKIRMTDVAPLRGGSLVAVGNYVGVQYGTATSWTSPDGLSWRRADRHPALEQGEMLAVAVGASELIAAGSFGAPDNYIPTIWRGPLHTGG